jgi:hypothetical protein
MTAPEKPTTPFSDEDGYYVRDPKAALVRTNEQLEAFMSVLETLGVGVQTASIALSPQHKALADDLRDALRDVNGKTDMLLALLREMATYCVQVMKQRQSTRDAYNAGWRDRYEDILSQLHPADQQMLRWIIEHLKDETDPW